MGGGVSRLITCLTLFSVLLFSACNHGKGSKDSIEDKPNGNENKKPTLKTFTINGENAMGGSVAFNGQSVTIQKEDVVIIFEEIGQQKDFTCSKEFPITIEAGKSETLIFKTQKKNNYTAQDLKVIITCTNLELLKESLITVHDKKVEKYSVELSEEKAKIETTNVKVQFAQPDAPEATFEGLPITLEGGKTYTFKIKTQETVKYASFDKTITVTCTKKDVPTELHLKKITVCEREAKDDKVTIPLEYSTVTSKNVKMFFDEEDAPKEVKCEPATLSLNAGEEKPLKVYTEATGKYKKCEKTIIVKRKEKKELHIDKLTIHRRSATSKSVTIKKETVVKDDVLLSFLEPDAPSEFTMSPESLTLPKNGKGTLTISTAETETYNAWNIEVEVKRGKDENDPKDIDDVIEALKSQLTWVDAYVDSDIRLPRTVTGFIDSDVKWSSEDEEHCDLSGHIKRDIVDVKVQFKATVLWNGNTKNVTFSTTIKRIEKIEKIGHSNNRYVWDLSEEGFLKYSINGKATHLWEISNVDIKKKELFASLKKKSVEYEGDTLLDLEDYPKETEKENRKHLERLFGDSYIALKKKNVITWQEFKAYFEAIEGTGEKDKDIFERLKFHPYFISYSGTFAEFNALNDAEKTKFIKEILNNLKKDLCSEFDIPKDIADGELVEKLIKKVTHNLKITVNNAKQSWKCRYMLGIESITIETIYDKEKKWYEQMGGYASYNTATRENVNIYCFKINVNEVEITLNIQKPNAGTSFFKGKCLISQFDSFTLKNKDDETKEVQCSITVAEDGKLTITTKGSIEETFVMDFNGKDIREWL